MLIHLTTVGRQQNEDAWIQSGTGLTLPRVGEQVMWQDGIEETVRTVVHYPWGCKEYGDGEIGTNPHVYIVVGKQRPQW